MPLASPMQKSSAYRFVLQGSDLMAKLLFIDDDTNLRSLYEQEYRDAGFEVITAASGPAGVERVRKDQPDLVVLDIVMPGMDGIETLTKILAVNKSIPIIINSANSKFRDNFMCWTADAYVVKSGDLTELTTTIWELLREHGIETPVVLQSACC
jgi:DNA-binding response OmpR family regulator